MKLKFLPTIIVKYFLRSIFSVVAFLFPINEKKVTFASYRSQALEGNLEYVYREMVNQYPDYQYHFLIKKFKSSIWGKIEYILHMVNSIHALATSKYFIIDDYYFPIYVIKPRKGTEIIQLWHAVGAFKKFGLSTVNKSYGPSKDYLRHVKVHSNYSKVYVSGKNVVPYYAEAFGMEESKIYPVGVPRTDFFFDFNKIKESIEKFYLEFPEVINKKVLLYAPTFRGKSHEPTNIPCPIDIGVLREMLGNEYILMIHLHPYMKKNSWIKEEDQNFVFLIEENYTIEELMAVADILITDYSSIIFDYSLLERPILFYANDLQEYLQERDFYFDYRNFIPGPFFDETQSLGDWILNEKYDLAGIISFKKGFFDYLDGMSARRIVSHIHGEDIKEIEHRSQEKSHEFIRS
ncbi:CDP-glycerol glycerophosphotransferase family protein [Bacillus sp. SD088]|uniref:CDP-glycerol glycerophosphotransferase family protein n=1 Tax=Bacillus sp. SD088 TaxID=2782012 RepID=UPI001A9738A5|nr:CDP-glycerol glycerophosphotransferase family protein [Bacillus sp. SD088]MBO0991476.1 CDP-glycerol glycerophosphotransferase family protein [Bacillus sp. SD088]